MRDRIKPDGRLEAANAKPFSSSRYLQHLPSFGSVKACQWFIVIELVEQGNSPDQVDFPAENQGWGIDFYPVRVLGRIVDLPMRMPNPSPTLDKNLASMGPGILSSIEAGVWRKAPEAFPDSNTTLDTFQSAKGASTNRRTTFSHCWRLLEQQLSANIREGTTAEMTEPSIFEIVQSCRTSKC